MVNDEPVRQLRVTGEVEHLIRIGTDLQRSATAAGIHNVMTDNGFQELIVLTMFGLKKLRREGNDAVDDHSREYELKTVGRTNSDVYESTVTSSWDRVVYHLVDASYVAGYDVRSFDNRC
jgi:hypothetical protein